MKRENCVVWSLVLLLTIFAPLTAVHAQTEEELYLEDDEDIADIDPDHDKIIKAHPLQFGEVYLSYEKMRTSYVSNEIGLSYVYASGLEDEDSFPSIKNTVGVAVRMSQRRYTSKKRSAPFGFFHGTMFAYRFMLYEEDALEIPQGSNAPVKPVGRLYQNSLELDYQLGWQFMLGQHFTMEVSGLLGARLKYARARNADQYLRDKVIGHELKSDESSVLTVVPSPQLNISVGYSF